MGSKVFYVGYFEAYVLGEERMLIPPMIEVLRRYIWGRFMAIPQYLVGYLNMEA